jgi:hypothetical protein
MAGACTFSGAQRLPHQMALTPNDHVEMLYGLEKAGFICTQTPNQTTNPILVEWRLIGQTKKFRLWVFDVTHGGGGSDVRAADEFRIQITNGPASPADFNKAGYEDLLLGYSRTEKVIVAYDVRWLEAWTKKAQAGDRGSPSVQVKLADIEAARTSGIHHITKQAGFGLAHIVTISPDYLPGFLMQHSTVLTGTTSAPQAQAAVPASASQSVADYCAARGFPFPPDLLARYIASMVAKPLVILAGVSGTGKSKMAELVAEYYSRKSGPSAAAPPPASPPTGSAFVFTQAKGDPDPSRFALVAVRPDWTDNQAILGFVNPITETYESTQTLDLILRARASANSAERFFLLLDEMNLARVEHYFSDWLSCTESRRELTGGVIKQQPVPLHRSAAAMSITLLDQNGTPQTISLPQSVEIPTNLIVTGTVNVDETTHGFSPKVLDRAMVIEFDHVDLDRLRDPSSSTAAASNYKFPEELPAFQVASQAAYAGLPQVAHSRIVSLNDILSDARLHVGYRAANEMAAFMRVYNDMLPPFLRDADWTYALDAAILQKILPRISGNRGKVEEALVRVCAFARDLSTADVQLTEEFAVDTKAKLERTFARSVDMLQSLREFGYVSFFK